MFMTFRKEMREKSSQEETPIGTNITFGLGRGGGKRSSFRNITMMAKKKTATLELLKKNSEQKKRKERKANT